MSAPKDLLGMQSRIARRDFLNHTLVGSGAALMGGLSPRQVLGQGLGWEGFSGVGDYKDANGNTEAVINGAHSMRDGNYDQAPPETEDVGETYDLVIVGGGIAGLTAALLARARHSKPLRILILENHPIFGGEARRNDFIVDGVRLEAPQGSNFLTTQRPGNLIDQVYKMIDLDPHSFTYQDWRGPDPKLTLSRHNYQQLFSMKQNFGFYFGGRFGQPEGTWVKDPLNNLNKCPWPAALGRDMSKFAAFIKKGWAHKDWDELTPAEEAHLDSITDEQRWQEQAGLSVEGIRTIVSPMVAQMVGLGADAVSGLYMYTWHKSQGDDPDPNDSESEHCFPGGNAGISRHLVKALIPDSIDGPATLAGIWKGRVRFGALDRKGAPVQLRLGSMVVRVEHDGEPAKSQHVLVTYAKNGKTYRVKTRATIMAGGGWAARRAIRDLPQRHKDAYGTFSYSAFLVANVAVRNWRYLHKLGLMGGRWFEGFGHWTEVRTHAKFAATRPTIGPDSPTVLTFYHPLMYPGSGLSARDQGTRGRTELIGTPYSVFERSIREHLTQLFGRAGFDAKKHIAGIVLNRWGHAFVTPTPGFFVGKNGAPAPRDVLRKNPHGRIAFSHGDLAGTVNHMHSITESSRAVDQVLRVLQG
jgi:spermidine dehydrogenase